MVKPESREQGGNPLLASPSSLPNITFNQSLKSGIIAGRSKSAGVPLGLLVGAQPHFLGCEVAAVKPHEGAL